MRKGKSKDFFKLNKRIIRLFLYFKLKIYTMTRQYNKFSRIITQDDSLPAAQAMLHAIGMNEDDQKKAQVGIVSTGFQGNPCNMHLNDLAQIGRASCRERV